jgi:type I restriction enzyme S subunit
VITLRDLLLDSRDGEWGKSEQFDQSVLMHVIRGTDFEDARLGIVDDIPVRHIAPRHAARKLLQPWDIIIETAGGSKDRPTGRTVLLTPCRFGRFDHAITCASFARFLRIDPNKAHPAFIFWLLQNMYQRRELLRFHTQHTGVARFQFTTFADNWPLTLPSMADQCRIANFLSAYDDLIANNTRRLAILEDMARRLFEEWFNKPILGRPEGWTVEPLRNILKLHYGKALKADTRIDGVVPVYGSSGAVGFHNAALVSGPGIILGRKGNVGSVFYSHCDFYPIDTVFYVDTDWPLHFIYHVLRQQTFTNSDSAVPGLNRELALSKEVVLPPRDLIDRFDAWEGSMVEQAQSLRDANVNLRVTRDLLLPKLISGEIEVSTAEEELEAAAA